MIRDEHRAFLIERAHADAVKHSGRSLYDHLCGTHALLEQWGNCEPVCTAGLFHSLYGTTDSGTSPGRSRSGRRSVN